ncbi:ABC transporter permease [Arthrobacter sp. MYb224]|uniref:ABC transporter permease n=1 Tax=Arthrobacter sp. MYb224 TaxID=1848600 RepID=UPI000CFC211F|nr:ABC transporter permease [Arthrobacter sp. MYb224]PRA00243.1 ABC transporter permease [Arthrobacter sp. MYb224]
MTKKSLRGLLLNPPVIVLLIVLFATISAPWISPFDPDAQSLSERLESPSWAHLLGTDALGRDTLSRVLHGGRFSLAVALITTLFSLLVGTCLGLLSALRGGWLDEIFLRVNDLLLALPEIVIALLIIAVMGPGFTTMVLSVGVVAWTPTARLVRSLAVQSLSTHHVEASKHVGASRWFILRHHVFPFVVGPVLAQAALRFGLLLVLLGSLSYLGIGVQPPQSDWGSMLADAQPHATRSPWGLIAPGAAIFLVSFCVTLLGNRITQTLNGQDVLAAGAKADLND